MKLSINGKTSSQAPSSFLATNLLAKMQGGVLFAMSGNMQWDLHWASLCSPISKEASRGWRNDPGWSPRTNALRT